MLVASYLSILIVCQLCRPGVAQNPSISFISAERVVNLGDTIDLHCSVQYTYNYPIIWAKIDPHNPTQIFFISRGSSLSIPDNRYSIRHEEASSTYTLQISKIQEVDAGTFQCQIVIATTSRVTANVKVIVNIPPVISDNSTRSVITSASAQVSLQCYAFGNPKPRISWRRENNDILPTGGAVYRGNILTIHNITKKDRGTYYCIADNGVGRGAKRNVGVDVEFSPEIRVAKRNYYQAIRHPADLECHVEAFPAPGIIWMKAGYQLNNDLNYQISETSTAQEYTDTNLRVKSVKKAHYGAYICKAFNKLGSASQTVHLIESPNPVCPPACSAANINGAESHLIQSTNINQIIFTSFLLCHAISIYLLLS